MIAAFRLVAANDHLRLPEDATVDLRSALTRHHAEDWIERLIAMLDDLDDESDREDDGTAEPFLGACERHPGQKWGSVDHDSAQHHWADGCRDDGEEDAGDEREKDCDSEEGDGDVDAEREPGDIAAPETAGAGWAKIG